MYLYKEMKEDIKQPQIVSKTNSPFLGSDSVLRDVRIKYKPSRQVVSDTILLHPRYLNRTDFSPVIQRQIVVAGRKLAGYDACYDACYIYEKCCEHGFENIAKNLFGLELKKEDVIKFIIKMRDSSIDYSVRSYKELNHKLCTLIFNSMPKRNVLQSSSSAFSFVPFSKEDMSQESPGLNPEVVYRPSSPVLFFNNGFSRMRDRACKSVSFHIGNIDNTYSVVGPGRFLRGVGTYRELLSNEDLMVKELNALLSGTQQVSSYKAANDMFALILGVEGFARSAHNIALARIFFANYSTIKECYPDQSLFQLAEMFLTFVQKGGAAASRNKLSNPRELQMLYAHCKKNNIPLTDEAIGAYLAGLVKETIERSGIQIPDI